MFLKKFGYIMLMCTVVIVFLQFYTDTEHRNRSVLRDPIAVLEYQRKFKMTKEQANTTQKPILREQADTTHKPIMREQANIIQKPIREQANTTQKPILREQADTTQKPIFREQANITQKPIMREQANITQKPILREQANITQKPILREVIPNGLYLFSAIGTNYHQTSLYDIQKFKSFETTYNDATFSSMVIIGWVHKKLIHTPFKCCFWQNDGSILVNNVNSVKVRGMYPKFEAAEFMCSLPNAHQNIRYTSLVSHDQNCKMDNKYYLTPSFPSTEPKSGVAFCCKVAYGNLEASYLVEWFELQKFIGVSKILIFTYDLNDDTMMVIHYYSQLGLVEWYPYDYPAKDEIPRSIEDKNQQAFSDASVTTFDCQERLRHYSYVSVTDLDEIIVPNKEKNLEGALPRALDKIWEIKTNMASLTILTRIHEIDPGSKAGESMLTSGYTSCSEAMIDREKNVYKPLHLQAGSVSTHMLSPLPEFKRFVADPDEIVLHHFRTPRPHYTKGRRTISFNHTCDRMEKLSKLVEPNARKVREELHLFTCFDKETKKCICESCKRTTYL